MKTKIIQIVDTTGEPEIWLKDAKTDGKYVKLSDHEVRKRIVGYSMLHEKARKKELNTYLRDCKFITCADEPAFLENVKGQIEITYHSTLETLMAIVRLFPDPEAGVRFLGYILAGLRCTAIRDLVPEIHFAMSFSDRENDIAAIVETLTRMVVVRNRWKGKHCKIKRKAVIDCRSKRSFIGNHFVDVSRIKVKGKAKVTMTAYYQDTVACIIDADAGFLREAMPKMENACVFLVGCHLPEWKAHRVPQKLVSHYNPEIFELLQENSVSIAHLLNKWWEGDNTAWANQVVSKAKRSFGKHDSRYVAVTLDPQKLRDAIVYRTLLSFLEEMHQHEWLTLEAADTYRSMIKDVFDPEPLGETPVRCMEDPAVFVEIMEHLMEGNASKIVDCDTPYRKADKPLGAYRVINQQLHFVMLEKAWEKAYVKAARAAKVDISFQEKDKWSQKLQKLLCDAGVIKQPSSGYRYRYDLLDKGERDSTYVLAMPVQFQDGKFHGNPACLSANASA